MVLLFWDEQFTNEIGYKENSSSAVLFQIYTFFLYWKQSVLKVAVVFHFLTWVIFDIVW